jgi:hypothetical protein
VPFYPIDAAALAGAKRALIAHDHNYAEAAHELAEDRVFFWRYVQSGSASPSNTARLKAALVAKGYLNPAAIDSATAGSVEVQPIAKQVIQYLLDAIELRESVDNIGAGRAKR